jgi:hypothetical protein
MAKLKPLRLKEKEFVFKAYGNGEDKKPAKVIFKRFPALGEQFFSGEMGDVFEGVDLAALSGDEAKKAAQDNLLKNYLKNVSSFNIDYRRFFQECVAGFKDFEYEDSKVETAGDFWRVLPPDAAYKIAEEAFGHASERDEFTMGE